MDKEIGPNSCRICLGQGAKFLFSATTTPSNSDTNNDPTFSQFDRLAEKMRFVGMINVCEADSLPKKLCYCCVVQLNVAYNLKNLIITTNMYLDRFLIETGESVRQPANDHHTNTLQLALPAPPAAAATPARLPAMLSSMAEGSSPLSLTSSSETTTAIAESVIETHELLSEHEIKQEIVFEIEALSSTPISVVTETSNRTTSAKKAPKIKKSPRKPMVSLHESVNNDNNWNRDYIREIFGSTSVLESKRKRASPEKSSKSMKSSFETILEKDLRESKSLREIFENMPKRRLRRRTLDKVQKPGTKDGLNKAVNR